MPAQLINTSEILKNSFFFVIFICCCTTVKAGLNKFSDLIFFEEWLIERKVDLMLNEIECRASIPLHASWFGARVRFGPNDELIKPIWISAESDKLLVSKLDKVKELLDECRAGLIFLPDNL